MDILSNLNKDERYVINLIVGECKNKGIKVYLVGGVVRDILLNKKPKDIDLCIECNPMDIVKNLHYVKEYKYYKKFQTSTIVFKNDLSIDLIRCRREIYEFNGSLPNIIPSNIYDDLYRRDFTVNAIAYNIIDKKYIDPYNGIEDLKKKVIKKVHENSYFEDPTRIFRAVKYASRYNFLINDIEEIKYCINSSGINMISNDRIMKEVISLCKEDNWYNNFIYCNKLDILDLKLNLLRQNLGILNYKIVEDRILHIFLCLNRNKEIFIDNSILSKHIKKAFKNYYIILNRLQSKFCKNVTNFQIYKHIKNFNIYELKICSLNKLYKYKIINYLDNLSKISLEVTGDDLYKLDIKPGEIYKKIFEYLFKLKLNTFIFNDKNFLYKSLGEIDNATKYQT